MKARPSRIRRTVSAAIAALALGALLVPAAAVSANAVDEGPGDIVVNVPQGSQSPPAQQGSKITNAQFRWGINLESGAGAFFGGCNFLSAGEAGNSGGAVVWTETSGLYSAQSGNTRIEKPNAAGEFQLASFANRCLDMNGDPVTVASLTSASHNQVVIDGGVGTQTPTGIEIRWSGSFTVAFYGGMTYWSVTDPVLTVDATGRGQVTATAGGYAASMEDLSKWEPIIPRSIVLADLQSVPLSASGGFTTEPVYLGVAVADAGQAERTSANADYWGAFPASFVQFQKITGQAGYWLTTNGQRDRAKPPTTMYISYDASMPIAVAPPSSGVLSSGGTPQNPLQTRPGTSQAAQQAAAPPGASYPLGDPTTLQPESGLLSDLAQSGLRNLLPLLILALSLCASAIAILNMKEMLPWQLARGSRTG